MTRTATGPLSVPRYRALWIAAIFSNVGSFLQTVAGSWLMKELTDSSATWVGLMVASNLLPLLFLSLIAGVVADMFGKAKVMLWAQVLMGSAAAAMALATFLDVITPGLLLSLGLLLGVGMAFNLPAWQSLVPDLVPRGMVASAVALNSAAFNVARAVGPALGGLIVATAGPELGFGLNALSYAGVIAVVAVLSRMLDQRGEEDASIGLITNSIGLSIRYARYTPAFRRVLGLVAAFAVTTAVIQAVLPNRTTELGGDETTYGILLGAMGTGALIAAFGRTRFDALRTGAALPLTIAVFGISGVVVGIAPNVMVAFGGMLVIGACWVLTLTVLNATTQLMTPHWVRGRAMSVYLLAFNGVLPLGSIGSGALADRIGAGSAMVLLSAATVGIGLTVRWFRVPRLDRVEAPEYDAARLVRPHVQTEGGPVMVINTWRVQRSDLEDFLEVMNDIRMIRLRTGAYSWRLYRNTEDPHRLSEVFLCASWEEHLAQHRRTDDASVARLRRATEFDRGDGPLSRHLIAVDVEHPQEWESLRSAHEAFHQADGSVPLIDVSDPASGYR
ncbi:MAG: MFS transporter [Acidimicrobiia bacterium]|nr:MFS transporter [Acidimicrobiia bacterium]